MSEKVWIFLDKHIDKKRVRRERKREREREREKEKHSQRRGGVSSFTALSLLMRTYLNNAFHGSVYQSLMAVCMCVLAEGKLTR